MGFDRAIPPGSMCQQWTSYPRGLRQVRDDGNEELGEAYNLIEVEESEKERKIKRKIGRKKVTKKDR